MHLKPLALLLSAFFFIPPGIAADTNITIPLSSASLIGRYSPQYNITYFRRIRFAASTSPPNRFRAPQPPSPYTGTIDADASFPACPQDTSTGDEDCLFLSVYSRPWNTGEAGVKRPVVVVLYGGGNVRGNANLALPPSMFPVLNASKLNDVVVVYPNYRVGAFGFLPGAAVKMGAESDLNAGLRDQRAALEWVREYIGAFGGDKDDVTVQGQSAGGGGVVAQILAASGEEKGERVFRRAVATSPFWGKTYGYDSAQAEHRFERLAELCGCEGTGEERLGCLKEVDVDVVRKASYATIDEFKYEATTFNWGPVVDGEFIKETLTDAVGRGKLDVDAAWGMYNQHEGETFVPGGLKSDNSTGGYNSSEASFDGWLRGYLPSFEDEDIRAVKALYPAVGMTDTSNYNSTYQRAGLIYRDSVLSCASLWVADAAKATGYLSEYAILPATHADDTKWWNSINSVQTSNPLVYQGYAGAMASFFQTGDPNAHKLTAANVSGLPIFSDGREFVIGADGFSDVPIPELKQRCEFWRKVGKKVPI